MSGLARWGGSIVLALGLLLAAWPASAQTFIEEPLSAPEEISEPEPVQYYRGRIVQIVQEGDHDGEVIQPYQLVKVRLTSGPEAGRELELEYTDFRPENPEQKLRVGNRVVVTRSVAGDLVQYYVADRYRLPALGWIFIAFLGLGVALGRRRGAMAILGLAISIFILGRWIVPMIVAGHSPLLVSLLGAVAIAVISLYLAHGFKRQTTVALAGTAITLGLAAALATVFIRAGGLLGLGSEAAYYLQFGTTGVVNLRGLLLGGILIGTLGVLDDITTAQAAVVAELRHANPTLSRSELYRRALRVGREHIASLINTLALAYAGASLPLFLFFASGDSGAPLWTAANSEMVAEEIIRTLVGSSALILAVPLTTALAVRALWTDQSPAGHAHA